MGSSDQRLPVYVDIDWQILKLEAYGYHPDLQGEREGEVSWFDCAMMVGRDLAKTWGLPFYEKNKRQILTNSSSSSSGQKNKSRKPDFSTPKKSQSHFANPPKPPQAERITANPIFFSSHTYIHAQSINFTLTPNISTSPPLGNRPTHPNSIHHIFALPPLAIAPHGPLLTVNPSSIPLVWK